MPAGYTWVTPGHGSARFERRSGGSRQGERCAGFVGGDPRQQVVEVLSGELPVEALRHGVVAFLYAPKRQAIASRSKKSLGLTTFLCTTEK